MTEAALRSICNGTRGIEFESLEGVLSTHCSTESLGTGWKRLKPGQSRRSRLLLRPQLLVMLSAVVAMTFLPAVFLHLLCILASVHAPLPFQQLQELGDGIHDLNAVSTDLTLGRPWEAASQHHVLQPSTPPQSAPRWLLDSPAPGSSMSQGSENAILHSPASRSHHLDPETALDSQVHLAPVPYSSGPVARVRRPDAASDRPQLDKYFAELIRDQQSGYMKLPVPLIYVSSPWLSDIYGNMLNSFRETIQTGAWDRPLQADLPEELLNDLQ